MSKGTVNKVILIGNLGADPDKRYTASELAITKLRLATTEIRRNRDTNETLDSITEWHRVTLFGKLGETAAQYLRKGSKVYIEGKLRTTKYQGQDGVERWSTEIIADDMTMLDRVGGGAATVPYDDAPRGFAPATGGIGRPPAPAPAAPDQGGGMPFDDDIPF